MLRHLQPKVKLLIDGHLENSQTSSWVDVVNPVSLVVTVVQHVCTACFLMYFSGQTMFLSVR